MDTGVILCVSTVSLKTTVDIYSDYIVNLSHQMIQRVLNQNLSSLVVVNNDMHSLVLQFATKHACFSLFCRFSKMDDQDAPEFMDDDSNDANSPVA